MEPTTLIQSSHTLPKAVFNANSQFLVKDLGIPRTWRDSKLINSSGQVFQQDVLVGNEAIPLRGNQIDLPTTGFQPVTPDGISPSSHFNFDAAHETYNLVVNEAIAGIRKQYNSQLDLAGDNIGLQNAAKADAIRQLDGFVGGMQDAALDGQVQLSSNNDAKVRASVVGLAPEDAAYSMLQQNRAVAQGVADRFGFGLDPSVTTTNALAKNARSEVKAAVARDVATRWVETDSGGLTAGQAPAATGNGGMPDPVRPLTAAPGTDPAAMPGDGMPSPTEPAQAVDTTSPSPATAPDAADNAASTADGPVAPAAPASASGTSEPALPGETAAPIKPSSAANRMSVANETAPTVDAPSLAPEAAPSGVEMSGTGPGSGRAATLADGGNAPATQGLTETPASPELNRVPVPASTELNAAPASASTSEAAPLGRLGTAFGAGLLGAGTALDLAGGASIANQFGVDSPQFASWAARSVPTELGTWGAAAKGVSTAIQNGAGAFDAVGSGVGLAGRAFGPAAVLGSLAQIGHGAYLDASNGQSSLSWNSNAGAAVDANKFALLGAALGTAVEPGGGTGIGYAAGAALDFANAYQAKWEKENPAAVLAIQLNNQARTPEDLAAAAAASDPATGMIYGYTPPAPYTATPTDSLGYQSVIKDAGTPNEQVIQKFFMGWQSPPPTSAPWPGSTTDFGVDGTATAPPAQPVPFRGIGTLADALAFSQQQPAPAAADNAPSNPADAASATPAEPAAAGPGNGTDTSATQPGAQQAQPSPDQAPDLGTPTPTPTSTPPTPTTAGSTNAPVDGAASSASPPTSAPASAPDLTTVDAAPSNPPTPAPGSLDLPPQTTADQAPTMGVDATVPSVLPAAATNPDTNAPLDSATAAPIPPAPVTTDVPQPPAAPMPIDIAPVPIPATPAPFDFAPPAISTIPDLSMSTPSLGLGATSGIGSSLPSLSPDLGLGLSTGLDSGLNTSSSFNTDSGSSSGLNTGLGMGLDTGLGSSTLDSGLGSSLDIGSSLDMNTGVDSGLGSSFDSGLGSSGGFGDSGSFMSSAGGDMGPVVLDLADQGIRLTELNSSQARFDADGNGVPNRIAWTVPDEGLLAYDANGSGTVDQTRELALSEWKNGAQTDLQGLAAFDTNHDGALDAPDKDFGKFDIWRDSNGNGVSDPGELSSLVEAGVKSIELASDGARSTLPDGSTMYGQGSFTRTDGSSGRLADVALAYAPDISAARDHLVGAIATEAGGAAPGMPSVSAAPPTGMALLMGINETSLQSHAR